MSEICCTQLRHASTIGEKLVKQQYLLHMNPQYGELQPTNGSDRFTSFGHPNKFQRVSRLGFVTSATSLKEANQTLHDLWPSLGLVHYTYIFGGSCPLMEFCPVQNWLYVQVLHCSILAALLHSTPAAGVSQTLLRGTRNGITEPSQRASPIFGWAAITLGIGPHCSYYV